MHDDFDDEDFEMNEEDELYFKKKREEEDRKLKTHPLYIQANEILNIVEALIGSVSDEDEIEMHTHGMQESAMIILVKLSAAITCDSYVICMQYAAIIRDHGHYLRLMNHSLNNSEAFDKKYVVMFRSEMEKFRELFKDWAAEIKKMSKEDEMDEWGLFMD